MSLFGVIAAIPAINAYRNAKRDYDALVEKKIAMEAAVRTYNQTKYLPDDASIENKSVDHMPGVLTTTIVRFGAYMFGLIWMRPSVVFTNMSDNDYRIVFTSATLHILKKYRVVMTDGGGNVVEQYDGNNQKGFLLKAGDTLEVVLNGGYTKLINPETKADDTQKLWDVVIEAQKKAGRSDVEIDGAVTADITTMWTNAGVNEQQKRSYYHNKPGVILWGK